jgi:hypothetical protein
MVAMVLLAVPTQAYFVAGGYNVALESSDSGATWTPQMTTSTNARFNGVAYGAGTWVAVGQSGAAFTSPTGDTWTQQTTGTTGTFNAIAFGVVSGNPMFAAVGANSNNVQMIYTSPNGVTWSAVPTPLPYNAVLNGITYGTPGGTGTFVAVGYGGLALTSTDGTTWNPQNTNGMPSVPPSTTTPPTLRAIAWGGNQFVTVGDSGVVKTSPDGVVWTQQTSGTTVVLWAVATSGTQWVAGGNNGVLLSSTNGGTTWTPATQLLPTPNYSTSHYWYGLAYGNGRWVAVSNSMYANSTTYSSPVVTSTDGLNWQYRPATGYYFYGPRAVAYANGQFVAAGYYNLLRSSNGLDWIVEHTMAQNFYTFGIAYSVTQDRGAQWVAVGYYGGTAYTSTNGHDWVARYTGVQWAYFYDIAWGAGRYVALDVYGNSITSTDGITWERVNGMGSNLYSIAFRAGQWMAVGYGGAVRVSEDGINWSAGSSPGSYYLYGVVWGGGNWTVVGGNGAILTSPDGITWTRRTSPTSQWLYDIAYDANAPAAKWVAIGYNTVVTSSNGVTWSLANTGVPSGSSLYRVDRDQLGRRRHVPVRPLHPQPGRRHLVQHHDRDAGRLVVPPVLAGRRPAPAPPLPPRDADRRPQRPRPCGGRRRPLALHVVGAAEHQHRGLRAGRCHQAALRHGEHLQRLRHRRRRHLEGVRGRRHEEPAPEAGRPPARLRVLDHDHDAGHPQHDRGPDPVRVGGDLAQPRRHRQPDAQQLLVRPGDGLPPRGDLRVQPVRP